MKAQVFPIVSRYVLAFGNTGQVKLCMLGEDVYNRLADPISKALPGLLWVEQG